MRLTFGADVRFLSRRAFSVNTRERVASGAAGISCGPSSLKLSVNDSLKHSGSMARTRAVVRHIGAEGGKRAKMEDMRSRA